jgi:hypothetical protein
LAVRSRGRPARSAGRPPATYQCAGAGQQFLEGERFTQVVVSTPVQPAHPVADRVARSEKEHGRVPARAAMAVEDRQPVLARQPPIEYDEVPVFGPQRKTARVAVGGARHDEALVRQPVHNRSGEARIVLDHQNTACHGNSSGPAI